MVTVNSETRFGYRGGAILNLVEWGRGYYHAVRETEHL